jgi:hypothetical protein
MSEFATIPPYPTGTPGHENKTGTFWPELSAESQAALATVEKWFDENNLQITDLSLECLDRKLIFLRYLRANNFDLKKTKAHVEKNVAWRKEMNVSEIVKLTPEQILGCSISELTKVFPHWQSGYDKTGRPVVYKQYGKFDAYHVKTLTGGNFDNVVRYHVWEQENCIRLGQRQTAQRGELVETVTGVVDVKDMRLFQITRDFLNLTKAIADVDQHQYPETLGRIYIINVPSVFPMVWSWVRVWLDPIVVSKIFIFAGPKEYEPALAEFIGKENLPSNYGGTLPALNNDVHPYAETLRDFYGEKKQATQASLDGTEGSESGNNDDLPVATEIMTFANGI